MRFLLDTDHVTIIQDGEGVEFSKLIARITSSADAGLALSIVSFHEQTLGAHTYVNRAVNPAGLIRG